MSGGFTGLAPVIHYLSPPFSVGLLYLILNIPVFVLGWLYVGKRFFFYSHRRTWTGHETNILYTVISLRELPRLKRLLTDIDKNVFMVVLDTMEVMGKRIGNQPHW